MTPPAAQFPFRKYSIPGVVTIATAVVWGIEQHLSAKPWWPEMPWLWVTACGLAFLAGMVWADIFNPQSRLNLWWILRRRFFDVIHVVPACKDGDGTSWIELTAKLRFIRRVWNASIIMHVYGVMNEGDHKLRDTIIFSKNESYLEGEEIDLVLMTVPRDEAPPKPCWGPINSDTRPPFGPHPDVVRLDVTVQGRTQTYRVYVKMMPKEGGTFGKFFYMGDNYEPFTASGKKFAAP